MLQHSRSKELLVNNRKYKFSKFIAIVGISIRYYIIIKIIMELTAAYITQPALVTGNKIIIARYAILQFRIITNSRAQWLFSQNSLVYTHDNCRSLFEYYLNHSLIA